MEQVWVYLVLPTLYLTPAAVAWARHHHNTASIAVINVLLGWTFVGWVVALAMAVSPTRARA